MLRIGSLFSGAGGLDLAVEEVFGGRVMWHCENNSAASRVLAERRPDVPNLHDITAADWSSVEPIDVLCAGWPCQPFSYAGKQKGIEDDRALWPHVARAIRALRPRYVVLENVAAVLRSPEFDRVSADLAASGYRFGWTCLRASDVGAAHKRERLFIVATDTARDGRGQRWTQPARQLGRSDASFGGDKALKLLPTPVSRDYKGDTPGRTDKLVGAIDSLLPTPNAADGARGQDFARASRAGSGGDDLVTLAVKADQSKQWGKYQQAIRRWEALTRPAPSPTEPNTKGNPRLAAPFSEWMMGWPEGHVTAVPGIGRSDQLRIIGNGVCPQQADAAIRWLLDALNTCGAVA